jgi:hypothetical protein
MPAVIDAPERVEHEEQAVYETHDLYEEQSPVREGHPGFWHTVLQYVKRHRARHACHTRSSSPGTPHPIEMPLERLAREHPALYLRAVSGV